MEHGTDVCPGVEGLALMVATRLFGFRFDAGQRAERNMNMPVVDIDDIKVEGRFRRDLGNVDDLAASIASIGLLNPVTVTADMRLIAGERRIAAHRRLGLVEIEARVAETISEARDLLVAERDENTQRKEMLPSEAVALGIAIQEMEAPAARERMLSGKSPDPVFPGTQGDKWGHKTRDIAAEAVGLSPATYMRLKTLATTAANESQPEEVREAAQEAMVRIDEGAPVRREYDRVKHLRERTGPNQPEPRPEEPRPSRPGPRRKHIDILNALVHNLDGVSVALNDIHEIDSSISSTEAVQIMDELTKQVRAIKRIKRLLEGIK